MFLNYDIADDSYYLFTCAELKNREIEFLGKDKTERMLRSKNMEGLFAVLRDTVYSRHINEMERSKSFEKIMVDEYQGIIRFLQERLKPNHHKVMDLLFLEQNIHNLKLIVKSAIMDTDLENLFIPLFYSYGQLRDAAAAGDYKKLEKSISVVLGSAVELSKKQKNYRLLELELEKNYLKEVFATVKNLDSRLITEYLRHIIDIMNIKNICRNKYLEERVDFDGFLHENGFLTKEIMAGFKDESLDFFVKEIGRTDYADIIIKGIHALQNENTFSSFEKNEDLFYIDFFDSVKFTVSNLEKIFQFFLIKKIEMDYLNIVFTGIVYNIEDRRIKSRVGV